MRLLRIVRWCSRRDNDVTEGNIDLHFDVSVAEISPESNSDTRIVGILDDSLSRDASWVEKNTVWFHILEANLLNYSGRLK